MVLPVLEVSIVSTTEQNITHLQFLNEISRSFKEHDRVKCITEERESKPYLKVIFESEDQFKKIYDDGFQIYSYIFEEVQKMGLNFDDIAEISNYNFSPNSEKQNYLVTLYRTDLIDPIRKNYRLASAFNQLIGCHVSYEEISNGFIRFVHSKEDYLSLMKNFIELSDWEMYFKTKNIDLTHPTIQKFLKIIEKMIQKFHR
ncbi:hypothetical protein NEF87_001827 [Candidatus Lokiarchaeum ossiferum]|uniref:Uncharacterized protein n=1 Tax=Candidatus Lokiarchaeum ossiferum TaxID=2951803 RepID=A0ABY6HPW8_9ARCH|nr:hypothetical protein NEF87_001827 [Candidatus Lokiarchaeum sp. B-35]